MSVHGNWKETRLLSPIRVVSVDNRLKTKDHRKLWNFKEILEKLGIDGKVLSEPPEKQILSIVLQNCEISVVKHSIEKPVI